VPLLFARPINLCKLFVHRHSGVGILVGTFIEVWLKAALHRFHQQIKKPPSGGFLLLVGSEQGAFAPCV